MTSSPSTGDTEFEGLPDKVERGLVEAFAAPSDEIDGRLDTLCEANPDHADAIRSRAADVAHLREKLRAEAHVGAGPDEEPPSRIGPYRILEVLGEGGMGTVYLAEQKEPLRRRVALKVIKLGMDSKRVLARFEVERQALALMNHDNIAKIYEAGTAETGQPYFVMEHVPGLSITEHCNKHRLTTAERLEMFVQVCAGVQHAHQKGIIHRDLKPSNVLVTAEQGRSIPKIIDFGMARATDHSLIAATVFTEQGRMVGTPEYMSPEQAEMSPQDIDTRTDIYSLGVILYELLIGQLPFSPRELRRAGLAEMHRKIREDDPQRPSTRLTQSDESSELAKVRKTTVKILKRELRGDLDWIVLKAMEKDRNRRYPTSSSLADELLRHLDLEPVLARPPSLGYRVEKYFRRNRLQASAAAVVAIALLAGGVAATVGFMRASRALEQFDLLATDSKKRKAETDLAQLVPPWPENTAGLRAWVERGDLLKEQSLPVQSALVDLLAGARDVDGESEFASERDGFLFETLVVVEEGLIAFTDASSGSLERGRAHLNWSEAVIDRSITDHRQEWDDAIAAILQPDPYGFDLTEQIGLVPLGEDSLSGLQEFYHLRSGPLDGPIPTRNPSSGQLVLPDDSGIVFVLIPGGDAQLGAQWSDENLPSYDKFAEEFNPSAVPNARTVNLEPFFIAKHELTRAQYLRLSGGEDPSNFATGVMVLGGHTMTIRNPIAYVHWSECDHVLRDFGLMIPSQDQWERAARGNRDTPWHTGDDPADLADHANMYDETRARFNESTTSVAHYDDGHYVTAPVGSFLPNPFGLHDVHGNVWEFCSDQQSRGAYFIRGGSFAFDVRTARLSYTSSINDGQRATAVGVRPARQVLPESGR